MSSAKLLDMERIGPLVHRAAHRGALLLIASAVVYLAGIGISASVLSRFSPNVTTLAELGTHSVSSLSYAFVAAGTLSALLGFVGALWIWTAFPARSTRTIGLIALEVGFVGQMASSLSGGVGWARNPIAQDAFLVVFYGAISVSMLILALAMLRDPRWGGFRLYTMISGFVSLAGTILTARNGAGPLSTGGAEWIAIAPWLAWLIGVGVHLLRFRVYSPTISAGAA